MPFDSTSGIEMYLLQGVSNEQSFGSHFRGTWL